MPQRKDYVVEISAPQKTWLGVASDEDDGELPRTTYQEIAARFASLNEANAACIQAAATYKPHAFRVGRLEPICSSEKESLILKTTETDNDSDSDSEAGPAPT